MPTVTKKEKKKEKAQWNNISHYLLFTYAYIIFLAKKKKCKLRKLCGLSQVLTKLFSQNCKKQTKDSIPEKYWDIGG